MSKQNTAVIATAIIAGVILIIALATLLTFKSMSSENTVSVQGVASVNAMPDEVAVYFRVEAKGETSSEAKDANSEILDEFISSLEALGLSREEIVTENYNIYQDYDWDDGSREENGFVATHTLRVEVGADETDKLGSIVDVGVDAGASINYINFELSQESQNKYKAEAMKLAAEDARVKAEAVATGFGKSVGKLVSVSVSDFNYSPWNIYSASGMDMEESAAPAKEAVANIQPGEEKVRATVVAVYKIR